MGRNSNASEAFLAVDVGTSSVRAALFGSTGERLASAATPCRTSYSSGSRVTLDPRGLLTDVAGVVRRVTDNSARVISCGVGAQLGIVLVDANLEPLGQALLWADRRAVAESEHLAATVGDELLQRSGRRADAELGAPKLLWLRVHEPDLYRKARWVLSVKDFIVAQLTGTVGMDECHASYTLLFDVVDRAWSPDLIFACGVDAGLLPPTRFAVEAAGNVTAGGYERLAVPRGIPVAVGGPDGTLGAIAAGASVPEVTIDVAGTTDVIVHTTDEPIQDREGRSVLNAHLIPDLWTLGGPTGLTGGAVAWLAQTLGYGSVEAAISALGEELACIEIGATGLHVATEMTGGRFPDWNRELRGAISGISPDHRPADLIRAAEESAAFLVRSGLDELLRLGRPVDRVAVVGGTAKQPRSMQLRANLWGLQVSTLADEQASLAGAAMVAAVAANRFPTLEKAAATLSRPGPEYQPDPGIRAIADQAYLDWLRWRARR